MFIFTYHQVMPLFLDFVFSFGRQLHQPGLHFSRFKYEKGLPAWWKSMTTKQSVQTQEEIRVCYNLRSAERLPGNHAFPWSIRQTAVYHTFDHDTGKTLWIILKDNKSLEKQLHKAHISVSSSGAGIVIDSWRAALSVHSVFFDWSGENWRWYLSDMEEKAEVLTQKILRTRFSHGPETRPSQSPTKEAAVTKITSGNQRYYPDDLLHSESDHQSDLTFSDLQQIHFLEEKVQEALLVAQMNIQVLNSLAKYQHDRMPSIPINAYLKLTSHTEKAAYYSCDDQVIRDFETSQTQLKSLLHLLENRKHLVRTSETVCKHPATDGVVSTTLSTKRSYTYDYGD